MPLALVTGSTGFIGSHICRLLLEQGWQVRAFHRPASPLANLQGLAVEHVAGDLTQPETLAPALDGVEAAFHVAAQLGSRSPEKLQRVTVEGTHAFLQAARQAGVRRTVYTSSVAALGFPERPDRGLAPAPIDENHSWNLPGNWWPYGYSKHLAEMEIQAAVAGGQEVVIVNPVVVVGPGDLHRISLGVIELVARGQAIVAPPGGLSAIHVSDVARGHLLALQHGQPGRRYILSQANLTHLEFLTQIAAITGRRPPWGVLPAGLFRLLSGPASWLQNALALPFSAQSLRRVGLHFYYHNQRAERELGFQPACSLEQAIREAYAWSRASTG